MKNADRRLSLWALLRDEVESKPHTEKCPCGTHFNEGIERTSRQVLSRTTTDLFQQDRTKRYRELPYFESIITLSKLPPFRCITGRPIDSRMQALLASTNKIRRSVSNQLQRRPTVYMKLTDSQCPQCPRRLLLGMITLVIRALLSDN